MSENQNLNQKTKRENINNKNENKKDNEMNESLNDNIIIGLIKVDKPNLKKRLINSYENSQKESGCLNGKNNEEEIKECDIYINDKKIDFSYYYKFSKEGNYKIKYKFKKILNSTNYMFYNSNS